MATAVLKVNIFNKTSKFSELAKTPYTKHIDTFFKCVNQFLDVINHNFLRVLQIEFKVRLPTYYHMYSFKIGTESQSDKEVIIGDSNEIIFIELGYLSIQGKDKIDKVNFNQTPFEISAGEEDDFEFF